MHYIGITHKRETQEDYARGSYPNMATIGMLTAIYH